MTKKKDKKKQRRNDTAHQRAMAYPNVQEAYSALRSNWNKLSLPQRGEQLQKLIDFGCSVRGVADDLGKKDTTLRRYIAQANSAGEGIDWSAMLEHTLAKEPQKEDITRARAAVIDMPHKIPAKQVAGPSKEQCPMQDHAQPSKAQQTKKLIASSSKRAEEPPPAIGAVTGQEDRAGQDAPRPSPLEQYKLRHPSLSERIRLLAEMPKLIEARPYRDARSMKRQGKPLPPTDTH